MNQRFLTIAATIIKNMYQIIMDVNTTIILSDKDGWVIEIWNNVSVMHEYKFPMKVGDNLKEDSAGINAIHEALKRDMYVELTGDMKILNKLDNLYSVAAPIHNAYDEIIGCLGVFGPASEGSMDFIRGAMNITIDALEGQQKALEFKSDYDKVYNQLLGTMETIPIGTIVTDKMLTIIHVNDAILKIFGNSIKDIVGKKVDDYLHTDTFFQNMIREGKTMMDEEMVFPMPDGNVNCEVIVSLVKGGANESPQGLVIKIKNTKYMYKFKKSKDENKAYFSFEDIAGNSKELQEAIRLGKIAARSTSNVLITGESGTGKELFAQSIHNHSVRREGPFVAVNCGALPSGLIESELFGYEGGAFTGARKEGNAGKFERANGGTIFLDEIGDMPMSEQISLLRVLQNKEIVRVGGDRTIKINVRVIAATNRDIEKDVLEDKFRRDLFYRLNVFSIKIPSLNERIEDVILLSALFLRKYSIKLNKEVTEMDEKVKHALLSHRWSGNIRELENVIERAVNIARTSRIELEDLPESLKLLSADPPQIGEQAQKNIPLVQEMEKMTIIEGLRQCNGNVSRTAELIGMGRRSIYRRLELYGIDNDKYKK